ncbi:MAG: pseudouridine synthase [Candidatus Cloacimonadaceae bacterium]|nr:pseudouridine synthase [Candidatus Cloacimonadaceae bacterium]
MSSSTVSSKRSSKTASKSGNPLRINRFLADAGLGSRRKVEELITGGKIMLNGEVCMDLSAVIDSDKDEVSFEGKPLSAKKQMMYLILNKPRGYIVSRADELKRNTVYELLPDSARNLSYAGRLDKNSEGLLMFTNDGDMINKLTHPNFKVEKVYRVDIDRKLNRSQLDQLRKGVVIEGGMTLPAGVFVKTETDTSMTLKMVITEGRKRHIRQMIEAVGAKVRSLRRLQFGALRLKELPLGNWRPLTEQEIRYLKHTPDKGRSKK